MFKKCARAFLLVFVLLQTTSVLAAALTVEEKMLDFQQLVGRIKASYGPLLYKKETQNIDIDVLQTKYQRLIQESKTNQDFYYLVNKFIAEFHDSHFMGQLPTAKRSKLPFTVELVQGKVYIDDVEEGSQFSKGDELVSINGVPTEQALNEILPYVGEGFVKTQKHFAAWMLVSRRSSRLPAPEGDVKITVRTAGKPALKTATMKWQIEGEDPVEKMSAHRGSFLDKVSIKEKVDSMIGSKKKGERRFICEGASRIEVPANATVVTEEPFVSYYYPTAKGNVGYVRIPHYYPEGDSDKVLDVYFSQYERVVRIMEENTVGLIIDQDHNCGGYVDLVNKMLGLFMDKPYRPMYFKMVANKENYLEYVAYAEETDKQTNWYDDVMKVVNLIKTAWQNGVRMTDFTSLDGKETFQPNMIRYTKPVVMLIDEMSGSGGDAFPALMQGYGRAKLVGTRTMGAGGHVGENPALNFSQIKVNMTRSMFFRAYGVPVENNGAVPDYPYEITYNDFMHGYKEYRNFYTNKLLEMIK